MSVPERLAAMRQKMEENGIDAYLVPTDDFHGSEYVGDYFKCRMFLTGFTGSAGTALVTVAVDGWEILSPGTGGTEGYHSFPDESRRGRCSDDRAVCGGASW